VHVSVSIPPLGVKTGCLHAHLDSELVVTLNRETCQPMCRSWRAASTAARRRGRFREGMGLSDAEVAAFEEYF